METKAFLLIKKIKQARKSELDIELSAKFALIIRAINLSYSGNWESGHSDSDVGQLERYNMAIDGNREFEGCKILKLFLTPQGVQGLQ